MFFLWCFIVQCRRSFSIISSMVSLHCAPYRDKWFIIIENNVFFPVAFYFQQLFLSCFIVKDTLSFSSPFSFCLSFFLFLFFCKCSKNWLCLTTKCVCIESEWGYGFRDMQTSLCMHRPVVKLDMCSVQGYLIWHLTGLRTNSGARSCDFTIFKPILPMNPLVPRANHCTHHFLRNGTTKRLSSCVY